MAFLKTKKLNNNNNNNNNNNKNEDNKKKWEEENGRKNGWRGTRNGANITPLVVAMETAEDGKYRRKMDLQ